MAFITSAKTTSVSKISVLCNLFCSKHIFTFLIWESIVFTSGKSKTIFNFFHVLGHFMPENYVKSEKQIPSVTRRFRHRWQQFDTTISQLTWEIEGWNFGHACGLGRSCPCHFLNIEILKFLKNYFKTSKSAKCVFGQNRKQIQRDLVFFWMYQKTLSQNFKILKFLEQKLWKTF
jgi:hypothetical protein